jgi:DNA-binding MarR family transcriptional regulator
MVARSSPFENSFGFILADISRFARTEFDRRVRDLGMTRAQWLVLVHLARRPGCTQTELADAMQMQKITVGRHAERLLRAGWIDRRDQPNDGRSYHLYVSRKAEPLIEKLAAMAEAFRLEYMKGIPAARRETLVADLLRIKSNLLRMDTEARTRSDEAS